MRRYIYKTPVAPLLLCGTMLGLTVGLLDTANAQRPREDRRQDRQQRRERVREQRRNTPRPGGGQPGAQPGGAPGGAPGAGVPGGDPGEVVPAPTTEQVQQQEEQRQQAAQVADEQAAAREQRRWNWVRQTLAAAGYTDTNLQNTVVLFMQNQERARLPLQKQAFGLTAPLTRPDTPSTQFLNELTALREALAKDTERYKTELAQLDETVKYSSDPKLEALLTLLGVVGNESGAVGGIGAIYPTSPMGIGGAMGGMGRGMGRGQGQGQGGAQGGQGGGMGRGEGGGQRQGGGQREGGQADAGDE